MTPLDRRPRLSKAADRGLWLVLGGLASSACLIPEYRIDEGGSGGNNGDGGNGDGTGGGTSSGGGSLPAGNGGGDGAGGATGGSGTGGSGTGGEGGLPSDWSCQEEESNLPGYYSNGTLCGYRFSFRSPSSGTGVPTLEPPCLDPQGSDCFDENAEHVSGTIPPSAPPIYPAIGIGMTLIQPSVGGTKGEWELEGHGVAVDYTAAGAERPARVQLRSGGDVYCISATRNTPLAWQDFRFECWDPANTETLELGDVVDELQVSVGSTDAEQTITELDIEEITLLAVEPPVTCAGCARLFVPFGAGAADVASDYSVDLGTAYDLSDPSLRIVVRVMVETAGTTGGLQVFLRSPGLGSAYFWHQLAEVEGWHDLVIAPAEGDTGSGYDPTEVAMIGLQVTSGAAQAGTVTADTTVYVDSLAFTGSVPAGLSDFTFADSLEGLTLETSTDVDGSTVEWVDLP